MPPKSAKSSRPSLVLVYGEDEYSVKRRAEQLFQEWLAQADDLEQEVIDGNVGSSGEALKALARVREALQTLPFFGTGKCVFLKNCNFLGEERGLVTQDVQESAARLGEEWGRLQGDGSVRLLISATKVDKSRKAFKALAAVAATEEYPAWQFDKRGGAEQAERLVREECRRLGKSIQPEALARLLETVGPNPRQLSQEVEKLTLYAGEAATIEEAHVEAVGIRNQQAQAFALADALGDRDLPRLLHTLKDELAYMRVDRQKTEIGLLYGLITKVRVLLLLKEMLRAGWIRPLSPYTRFKSQWEALPEQAFPRDKRFNPKQMSPYVFFKALSQAKRYRTEELVEAMDRLLECNQRLVTSGTDASVVLQQALVSIVKGTGQGEAVSTSKS